MKKFILIIFLFVILSDFLGIKVCAENRNEFINEEIFTQQLKDFGIEEFYENFFSTLPDESNEYLKNFGINQKVENFLDFENMQKVISKFSFQNIVSIIWKMIKKKFNEPFKLFGSVLAVVLLYVIISETGYFLENKGMQNVLSSVATICVCMNVIDQLVKLTSKVSLIMRCTASFILCYVPICSGIMIAVGNPVTATFYHGAMLGAGQIVSFISSEFLMPVINGLFGLSTISAISSRSVLRRVCELIQKIIIWILGFSVTVFVGILSLQSMVSSGVDGFNAKIVKFALVSFVPIIGSALSDSFLSFQGGIKLLKTSLGSFSILAGSAIFIPIIVECIIWMFFLKVCSIISFTFKVDSITNFFKAFIKIMEVLFAIVLSGMLILTVSTALMMVIQN